MFVRAEIFEIFSVEGSIVYIYIVKRKWNVKCKNEIQIINRAKIFSDLDQVTSPETSDVLLLNNIIILDEESDTSMLRLRIISKLKFLLNDVFPFSSLIFTIHKFQFIALLVSLTAAREGQYIHDDSGRYKPDGSGSYRGYWIDHEYINIEYKFLTHQILLQKCRSLSIWQSRPICSWWQRKISSRWRVSFFIWFYKYRFFYSFVSTHLPVREVGTVDLEEMVCFDFESTMIVEWIIFFQTGGVGGGGGVGGRGPGGKFQFQLLH